MKPLAWRYQLARSKGPNGYTNWGPDQVSITAPNVPEESIRNLTPLYPEKIHTSLCPRHPSNIPPCNCVGEK